MQQCLTYRLLATTFILVVVALQMQQFPTYRLLTDFQFGDGSISDAAVSDLPIVSHDYQFGGCIVSDAAVFNLPFADHNFHFSVGSISDAAVSSVSIAHKLSVWQW